MNVKTRFDRWFGRGANLYSLWPLIPAGVIAVVSGFLSQGVEWIEQFGAFGWLSAAIVSFGLVGIGLAGIGIGKEKWALARAVQKWSRIVDSVNPLETDFARQRIKIQDLAHPITGRIKGKRFTDCELIGRANILIMGKSTFTSTVFLNCDIILLRDDIEVPVHNAIILEDVHVLDCEFSLCTVLISPLSYDKNLVNMDAIPITFGSPKSPPTSATEH